MQFVVVLLLLFPATVRIAGVCLGFLYLLGIAFFGPLHMLDYVFYVGAAWYFFSASLRSGNGGDGILLKAEQTVLLGTYSTGNATAFASGNVTTAVGSGVSVPISAGNAGSSSSSSTESPEAIDADSQPNVTQPLEFLDE